MKILLTGKDGQVGRSLIERGSQTDIDLVAVGRDECDLTDADQTARVIAKISPDVVINAAAYTAVDRAEDESEAAAAINAAGAAALARAAKQNDARFIQLSTDYVFAGGGAEPHRENDPTGPLGVYGATKLAGERAVADVGGHFVIARTAWVHGPHGQNFTKTMLKAAHGRPLLRVVADQFGNPTNSLDLADGLLRLVAAWGEAPTLGLGEVYNLAGTGSTTWAGLAEAIFAAAAEVGLPTAEIEPIASEDWPTRAVRPRNSRLNTDKFTRDFGWQPPHWRASVGPTVARLAAEQRAAQ